MSYSSIKDIPFLTVAVFMEQEIIGIIGNRDDQITSMYVLSDVPTKDMRKLFLKVGEEWWWETNRQVPINIALRDKWQIFKPYLKNFNTKEFKIISGPCISLDDVISKKIKRKQIQLVRKLSSI